MAEAEPLKALVAQMPDHDPRGLLSKIDKQKVETALAEIHKGGPENVLGLIDLLVPPGKGNDIKAHYALHCLAVHVCKLDDDEPRQAFAQAVASQLGGDRPKAVQKYLCRVLQVAGGQEVAAALGKVLTDEALCEPAAQALVAIREGAADQLAAVLPKVKGKRRLTIVQNLGVVRGEKALDALKAAVGDADRGIRIAATWSLANIGDPTSASLVIKAADSHTGWERIQGTKACLLLAEKLLATDEKDVAKKIYTHLRDTRTDPAEKYVRDIAEKALATAK